MDDEKLEEIYEKYIAYLENNPSVKVRKLSIREVVDHVISAKTYNCQRAVRKST